MNIKKRFKVWNWQRIATTRAIKLSILRKCYKSRKVFVTEDEFKKCRKILVFISSSCLGDAIVVTGLLKALKDKGFEVTIIVAKRLAILFEESKLVDRILVIENTKKLSANSFEKAARNGPYDLLMDFGQGSGLLENLQSLNLYKIFKPRYLAGFNDVFKIFDISIKYEGEKEHFSKRFDVFLTAIGICDYQIKYTVNIPSKYAEETEEFLGQFRGKKIVCLNPFASDENRNFSLEQIIGIANHLNNKENVRMILIGEPYQLQCLKKISLPECAVLNNLSNFFNAAYIVKKADLVISTDTSIVHLAHAYDKKLICLYNNRILADGRHNNIVWAPNYDKAIQLFTKERLGILKGDCISNFDVAEINYHVDMLL